MLEKYPEKIKLVFKNTPLPSHRFANKAAAAALAAHAQRKFWTFHNALFKSYRSLSDAKIQEIAKQLGLDMERFNRDIHDPAVQKLIARDVRDGQQVGIRELPAVFVNGKIAKDLSLQGLQQIVEDELKRTSHPTK